MRAVSRVMVVVVAAVATVTCGGGGESSSTPTAPTQTQAPTRIINITGNLSFGQVALGSSQSATFTISNTGNSTLNVSGISATSSFVSQSTLSWTSGAITAGASQTVTLTFRPTTAGVYNGTIAINGDHTAGTNTIGFSATGVDASPFSGNWSGNYVVERCEGTGSVQDILCSAPSGSRPGGIFPVATTLPITMSFVQNGSTVTGTFALGNVTGPGTGAEVNGVLTLQGTARNGTLTAVISQWSTQVSGNTMTGTASFNVTVSGAPGTGVLVTRLSNVRK